MNDQIFKTLQSILIYVEDLHLRGDDDFKRAEIRKLIQEALIKLKNSPKEAA